MLANIRISYLISLFSATFLLLLIGNFFFAFSNLSDNFLYDLKLYVYLEKNLSNPKINTIKKKLEEILMQNRIKHTTKYQSKDEAFKEFLNDNLTKEIKIYSENPLRDNFEIKIKRKLLINETLDYIHKIQAIDGVYEVEKFDVFPDKIKKKIKIIFGGLCLFTLGILAIVVLGIFSNIKSSLFSQRFLIRTMALVGAKRKFIEFPYLFRNILATIVVSLLASGAFLWIVVKINFGVENIIKSGIYSALFLLIFNIFIAYFSTKLALNIYLKMTIDDFYKV